jgi:hypothetical protein
LAIAVAAIGFTSCKKEYTCSCTTTVNFGSGVPQSIYKDNAAAYNKKMNEKTAKAACDEKQKALDASWKNGLTDNGTDPNPGVTASTSCDLKD